MASWKNGSFCCWMAVGTLLVVSLFAPSVCSTTHDSMIMPCSVGSLTTSTLSSFSESSHTPPSRAQNRTQTLIAFTLVNHPICSQNRMGTHSQSSVATCSTLINVALSTGDGAPSTQSRIDRIPGDDANHSNVDLNKGDKCKSNQIKIDLNKGDSNLIKIDLNKGDSNQIKIGSDRRYQRQKPSPKPKPNHQRRFHRRQKPKSNPCTDPAPNGVWFPKHPFAHKPQSGGQQSAAQRLQLDLTVRSHISKSDPCTFPSNHSKRTPKTDSKPKTLCAHRPNFAAPI